MTPCYEGLPFHPPRTFGRVRLKMLLALCRTPQLDTPGWTGRFVAEVGPSGQVKAGIDQHHTLNLEEVRVDDQC